MQHLIHKKQSSKHPSYWISLLFGAWLSGVFSIRLLSALKSRDSSEGLYYIVLLVVAIVWPLVYFAGSRCKFKPPKLRTGNFTALCIFFLFSLFSSFASPVPFNSFAFITLTIASTLIALQYLNNMDNRQLEQGLKLYSFLMAIILLAFSAYDYVPGERLGEGRRILNPNSIAMVAFSATLASTAFRNLLIRYALFSLLFAIIYLTGSRASAVGTLLGAGVITFFRVRGSKGTTKILFFIFLVLVAIGVGYYGEKIWPIINSFMGLNTSDRGISSGASGRIYAWMETFSLFEENPIFGIGFRAHEHLLTVGSSSHNGYLAMLAEIGLFGFLAVMYLILSGTFFLWKQARFPENKHTHSILLGILIGYLFLAVFERFLINVGNPTSLLFLLGILTPTLAIKQATTKSTPILGRATRPTYPRYKLGKTL